MEDVDQSQDDVADDQGTRENVGMEPNDSADALEGEAGNNQDADDPYRVKKRLGMQAKKHAREMQRMQDHIMHLQNQMEDMHMNSQYNPDHNPYPSPGQPNPPDQGEEARIQRAVRYALEAKENESKEAKMRESHAHLQRQYQRLNHEFDKASDKYEDFDDVVRSDDAPFTPHVRDALLLVDNPADVAYHLGKKREDLQRIANLHPLDQAREINKLSFALLNGNGNKPSQPNKSGNPLGDLRANPAKSGSAVTDKTSAGDIRRRMKAGTWK